MSIKLLLSDLDGTLLFDSKSTSNKSIPKENIAAIKKLENRGIKFGFCTGRPITSSIELANESGIKPIIISENGNIIAKSNGEIILKEEFMPNARHAIMEFILENDYPFISFATKDSKSYFLYNGNNESVLKRIDRYSNSFVQIKINFENLDDYIDYIEHITVVESNQKTYDILHEKISKEFPNVAFIHSVVDGFDILDLNQNKVNAIKKLISHNLFKRDEIAYIGDGMNDFESIKFIENSFAMNNGRKELKDISKYKVSMVSEAIEIILNEEL